MVLMKVMNRGERALLVVGLLLLAIYTTSEVYRVAAARVALARFRATQTTVSSGNRAAASKKSGSNVDFSLWSDARIQAYLESLGIVSDLPVAVLQIPKLHIDVPVFNGTDDVILNRGAGRIIGTGVPGEGGNVGISAHRDGFFRALKDIRIGDSIALQLPDGTTEKYRVDEIQIVTPENVDILRPRAAPSVTLVTCYPFYFIGSAPKRFIVQGSLQNDNRP
jgi:sortase A